MWRQCLAVNAKWRKGEGGGGGGEGGGEGGVAGSTCGGEGDGHDASCQTYLTSSKRVSPTQCVRPKKQQPLDATLSSAQSPSALHPSMQPCRLAPQMLQPAPRSFHLPPGRLSGAADSVAASAAV